MAIQLRAYGQGAGAGRRVIGRVARGEVPLQERSRTLRVLAREADAGAGELEGYAAVLREGELPHPAAGGDVGGFDSLEFLRDGQIAVVDTATGYTRVLYRPDSPHNALFVTEACNSNCLMCSQPPKAADPHALLGECLQVVDLIDAPPEHLGITGGEPTLLGPELARLLARLKERFPQTPVTMLTNARHLADAGLADALAQVCHPNFLMSVPLYAGNPTDHDYVVQAQGAFVQTVRGLYNAAERSLAVELRVVLHRQTVDGLTALAEFVWRNTPFVRQVAFMGLENMGYVKKNWDLLWIDPLDYAPQLEAAVRHLYLRRVPVSLYNLPLCVLPRSLWSFARQSISDFKNIYLSECDGCAVRAHCSGLFQSSETRHSRGIRAFDSVHAREQCDG